MRVRFLEQLRAPSQRYPHVILSSTRSQPLHRSLVHDLEPKGHARPVVVVEVAESVEDEDPLPSVPQLHVVVPLLLGGPGLHRMIVHVCPEADHVAVHGRDQEVHLPVASDVIGQHHGVGVFTHVHLKRAASRSIDDVQEAVMRGHNDVADRQPRPPLPSLHLQQEGKRHDRPSGLHREVLQRPTTAALEGPDVTACGGEDDIHQPVAVHVPDHRALRGEAGDVSLPDLLPLGVEHGYVVSRVRCDNLKLTVVVDVRHRHLPLNLRHGHREVVLHPSVMLDHVHEAQARSQNDLQLAVRVEVSDSGGGVDVGAVGSLVGGQVKVNVPFQLPGQSIVDHHPASHVLLGVDVHVQVLVGRGITVLLLVKVVGDGEDDLVVPVPVKVGDDGRAQHVRVNKDVAFLLGTVAGDGCRPVGSQSAIEDVPIDCQGPCEDFIVAQDHLLHVPSSPS
mmetsp:Transcript_36143/g.112907  ORF Transcript_36143/g.112907 Transcript_36143/m.112907 type:complete len:449 (-) Transcript_36143:1960-3306(-)